MREKIAEFMADLFAIGMSRKKVGDRGYEYAIALQVDELPSGMTHVSSQLLRKAAQMTLEAMPDALSIYRNNCL